MSINSFKNRAKGIAENVGSAGLHATLPDDFEYYACSFELLNEYLEVLDFMNFPIMPDSISINQQNLVSQKKTGRSYLSQFNDSFVGKNISIKGTFGKKMKILATLNKGKKLQTGGSGKFDLKVKTGYGALKLMEKIINRAYEAEDGVKYLIFNNLAFNQSFIVEVLSFNPTMSLENNMFWNYALEMKSLANANELNFQNGGKGRLIDSLAADLISDTGTEIANDLKNLVPNEVTKYLPL